MNRNRTSFRIFWVLAVLGGLAIVTLVTAGCQRDGGSVEAAEPAESESAAAELERVTALTERERELAAREAELAAREEQIALQERAAAPPAPKPAPKPVAGPAPRPAASPAPAPTVEAVEPAPVPAAEPAVEAEPEPAPSLSPAPLPAPAAPPEPRTVLVTVPAGTELEVEFLDSLSSEGSRTGDEFRARVSRQVLADGRVAIPVGSIVRGTVTEAVSLKKVGGRARLALEFDRLEIPSGDRAEIRVSFADQGKSETKKDAATIGGAAAGGAIVGRLLNRSNKTKGGTIGAILGAAVGTAVAARTEGEEVVIERGTVVGLKLDAPVRLEVPRR